MMKIAILSTLAALTAATEKFVLTSTADGENIYYVYIGANGPPSDLDPKSYEELTPKVLVDGLHSPGGLAVAGDKLYVADTQEKTIIGFDLSHSGETLYASKFGTLVRNVDAQWVAADDFHNVYYTDAQNQQIFKLEAGDRVGEYGEPRRLYSYPDDIELTQPGGIVADSRHIYFTSQGEGLVNGVVHKAFSSPPSADRQDAVMPLAKNAPSAETICAAQSNIFYTDENDRLFVVKKQGSAVALVSDALKNPKGCAYDNDGTLYLAQQGDHGLYAFAANMQNLAAVNHMVKVATISKPLGVAVYSDAVSTSVSWILMGVLGLFSLRCF